MTYKNIGILLVDFSPGRMGGVETYVRNLVQWLVKNDRNRYTLICHDGNSEYFKSLDGLADFKVFPNRKGSIHRLMRSAVRKLTGIDMIQRSIDKLDLDLIHNPFTAVRSSRIRTPLVVTFHDLQHRYLPQFFKSKEIQGRDRIYRKAAIEADHIIADSEYTKMTILKEYGIASDKITVVPLGVGPEYRPYSPDYISTDQAELGLIKPFIYYPAATWPHKNHKNLLLAFNMLVNNSKFDGNLVFTGVSTSAQAALAAKIAELGLNDRVQLLGHLPFDKLPIIYNLARIMVFPSLFEGFGMPVLEAMACGCPVVCSNVTSIPEVAGEAAIYFDPCKPEAIAESILKVWTNQTLLENLRMLGLKQASLFNWDRTAEETLKVYSQLLN